MRKKVLVALSGGIDSTVAALLLKEEGFLVYGIHFILNSEDNRCGINNLSRNLKIPVHNVNINREFDEVKQHFSKEYLHGRTPSPCTYCNRMIKWKTLLHFADKFGYDYISSGHYIRQTIIDDTIFLQKATDPVKDQSYFLWELNSEIINRMITPLGNLHKKEVREYAKKNGFPELTKKNESMGVCFLQKTNYRDFLKSYIPAEINKIKEGNILDENNHIIGTHNGYINYTIGQKQGLHLKSQREAYVSEIIPESNEIKIGTKESLWHQNVEISNLNLINQQLLKPNYEIHVNVRGFGLNPEKQALVTEINKNKLTLHLGEKAWAVAPGQPIVFYKNDVLLGGGIAEKSW